MDSCPVCNSELRQLVKRIDKYSYYYCPDCTLITSLPLPSDKEISSFYNGFLFSKPEDEAFSRRLRLMEKDVGKIAADIKGFGKTSGASLLDVGGGLGFYSNAFAGLGFDVTMIDLDKQSCDYARSKFGGTKHGKSFKIINADPLNHKFGKKPSTNKPGTKKFDIIFCNGIIEHYKDMNLFLDTMKKLLKPDGIMIIISPNQECKEFFFRPLWFRKYLKMVAGSVLGYPRAKLKFLRRPWVCCDPPRHLHSFNNKSLGRLLEKKGFSTLTSFTEYSTIQNYSVRMYDDFRVRRPRDLLRVALNIYARAGIRLLSLLDRKNRWGNNIIVFAGLKEGGK